MGPRDPPKLREVTPQRGDPLGLPSRLPPSLDSGPPAAGCPQAARKWRGPDTPKLSARPQRGAPLSVSAEPKLPARGSRADSPSSLRLARHPLALRRSSFISTHRRPPFSSQPSFK